MAASLTACSEGMLCFAASGPLASTPALGVRLPAPSGSVSSTASPRRPRAPQMPRRVLTTAATPRPPRRGADAVRALRGAMQAALGARRSRLAVRLPDGAALGIERGNDRDAGADAALGGNPTAARPADGGGAATNAARADRELARCVVALFEGTGLSICTVFPARGEMDAARKRWGAPDAVQCAFDYWTEASPKTKGRRDSSKKTGAVSASTVPAKKGTATGFGGHRVPDAKHPAEGVAENPGDVTAARAHDVYVVISPRQQAMARVVRFCESIGNDRLVILVNCRADAMRGLPADVSRFFSDTNISDFEDVYYWKPDPSPTFAGGVLFREFPHNYVLCRRTPLGTLQVLLESETRPSEDEITATLREQAEKPSNTLINKVAEFLDRR